MKRGCGFVLAVFAAALICAGAGCNKNRRGMLSGSPAIPRRDAFRYVPLAPREREARKAEARNAEGRRAAQAPIAPHEAAWLPAVKERPWRWIVVHHSATRRGCAAIFDDWHRSGRRWDELGYHFVIGNGTDTGEGQIEVGSRWIKQKHGAHCKVWNRPEYNEFGVGVCLVGDFETARPSKAQMHALARLVDWLSGRYRIPEKRIIGHGHVSDTRCPGRNFLFDDFLNRLRARRTARAKSPAARDQRRMPSRSPRRPRSPAAPPEIRSMP